MIKDGIVNILGTDYNIKIIEPTEEMIKNNWVGLCNSLKKEILISDLSNRADLDSIQVNNYQKETLRHEIIHAFFNESGLQDSSFAFDGPWAKNEEMVDWLAIQIPKIVEVMKSIDCL
jgi:hypothetical protein